MSQIRLTEVISVLDPPAGVRAIYATAEGIYVKDSTGGTTPVGGVSTETLTLSQNIFGGVKVLATGGTLAGSVYLPAGTVKAGTEAYLNVEDAQNLATLTVRLVYLSQNPVTVAEFPITITDQFAGFKEAIIPAIVLAPLLAGWYAVTATFTDGGEASKGVIFGIRLIVNPPA
jgi:hypothetical protein